MTHHTSLISTMKSQPAVVIPADEALEASSVNHAKKTKRVSFHEARVVSLMVPASELTADEKDTIWYSDMELFEFKEQVRDMCRKLRDDSNDMSTSSIMADSFLRGLEHRVHYERQRYKLLTLRCILTAQRRIQDPDQLAHISMKCTHWNAELAYVQGSRDYCEAHAPDMLVHIPGPSAVPEFPFSMKSRSTKRVVSIDSTDSSAQESAKRCRRELAEEEEPAHQVTNSATFTSSPPSFVAIPVAAVGH